MYCPPVSPGGERGPRGSPGTRRGGGAHREPVVKVGSAPGARPGRGEAGRRGSGIGSWRGWGAVPVVLRGSPLRLGRHREHGRGGAALLSLIGMFTNLSNANIKVSSWLLKGTV